MILFHLQTLGAGCHFQFFELLKNKNLRSKSNLFLSKNHFFAFFLFVLHVFTGKRSKMQKTTNYTVKAIQFPTK